jgi:hypothetical protein
MKYYIQILMCLLFLASTTSLCSMEAINSSWQKALWFVGLADRPSSSSSRARTLVRQRETAPSSVAAARERGAAAAAPAEKVPKVVELEPVITVTRKIYDTVLAKWQMVCEIIPDLQIRLFDACIKQDGGDQFCMLLRDIGLLTCDHEVNDQIAAIFISRVEEWLEKSRWIQLEGTDFVNEFIYCWYRFVLSRELTKMPGLRDRFRDSLISEDTGEEEAPRPILEEVGLWTGDDEINEQVLLLVRCDTRFCEPGREAVVFSEDDWFVGD